MNVRRFAMSSGTSIAWSVASRASPPRCSICLVRLLHPRGWSREATARHPSDSSLLIDRHLSRTTGQVEVVRREKIENITGSRATLQEYATSIVWTLERLSRSLRAGRSRSRINGTRSPATTAAWWVANGHRRSGSWAVPVAGLRESPRAGSDSYRSVCGTGSGSGTASILRRRISPGVNFRLRH